MKYSVSSFCTWGCHGLNSCCLHYQGSQELWLQGLDVKGLMAVLGWERERKWTGQNHGHSLEHRLGTDLPEMLWLKKNLCESLPSPLPPDSIFWNHSLYLWSPTVTQRAETNLYKWSCIRALNPGKSTFVPLSLSVPGMCQFPPNAAFHSLLFTLDTLFT